jgi:putative glutamine amidotransferase
MDKVVIGITDGRLYENYAGWIADGSVKVELVRLGYRYNNLEELKRCDGLFMTGGEDVHPKFYNKNDYLEQFTLTDIDINRDEFEIDLLRRWQSTKIPLLGVCRGLQIFNVFMGGTLVPDLPSFGKFNHSKKLKEPRYHSIEVDPNSELGSVVKKSVGDVTSIHHQSIDRIAPGLVTNAITMDGVIEGVEWLNPQGKTPVVLVQWHPEVIADKDSPFAKNIREHFIRLIKDNS